MAYMRQQNRRISRFVPYGYRLIGSALEPEPEEQLVLVRIGEMRAGGVSLRGICDALGADQIPAKRGGAWAPSVIRGVIRRTEKLSA